MMKKIILKYGMEIVNLEITDKAEDSHIIYWDKENKKKKAGEKVSNRLNNLLSKLLVRENRQYLNVSDKNELKKLYNSFSLACLAFSPRVSASSSVNSELDNLSSKNSANSNLRSSLRAAFLNTSTQFISGCASICAFNSLGNDIVFSAIEKEIDNKDLNVSGNEKNKGNYNLNLFTKSFVLNTSTSGCFMNFFSPDQIGQFNLSANEKYGISLPCGDISFALENLLENSFVGTNLIRDFSNSMNRENSASESPESFVSLCTFFSLVNSSNSLYGAYSLTLSENNISSFFVCILLPLAIIEENNSLASTTSSIIYNSGNSFLSSLYMDSSISEATDFASSSDNLDLNASASNTALCNAIDLDKCISKAFAIISSLASFDNSEYDFSISSLNSEGTSNLITISVINNGISNEYINLTGTGEKMEKGSNRVVEPNRLIPSYSICTNSEYINISFAEGVSE